ncbi:MAG: ATP-grasp domain-containing protein [Polyangiaceae bacterium]|nr:ATP-grasp domain-containing protein [Polyangiaceae bacterium]
MIVGILGGGQLGVMLREAIAQLSPTTRVLFLEADRDAPAAIRYPEDTWTEGFDDAGATRRFLETCDVVTYETEHVPVPSVTAGRTKLVPSIETLAIAQNRAREKEFLRSNGLPCAPFVILKGRNELSALTFDVPRILKTCAGGYDGKGQARVSSASEADAFMATTVGPWVLEDLVPFMMEASCILGRATSAKGVSEKMFAPFENLHVAHILDCTVFPARLPIAVQEEMLALSQQCANALDLHGLLTVEFFVVANSNAAHGFEVLINEIAPRPHNSGHVTRVACETSQFTLLAEILLGLPLTDPRVTNARAHCMANLLGNLWPPSSTRSAIFTVTKAQKTELGAGVVVEEIVDYGKSSPRAKRKMGHLTVSARSSEEALEGALLAREGYRHSLCDQTTAR